MDSKYPDTRKYRNLSILRNRQRGSEDTNNAQFLGLMRLFIGCVKHSKCLPHVIPHDNWIKTYKQLLLPATVQSSSQPHPNYYPYNVLL